MWWKIGIGEKGAGGVLLADGGLGAPELLEGPVDGERGVAPKDGALPRGKVEVGRLVENLGGVGEDEKSVGEAFRDPKELQLACFGGRSKVEARPPAEVRRAAPQVDGNIPDMAGEDAHELALGLAKLIMQAAENAFARERLVVLNEVAGKTCGSKGLGVEELREPTSIIFEAAGLYELDSGQGGFEDIHQGSLTCARWGESGLAQKGTAVERTFAGVWLDL